MKKFLTLIISCFVFVFAFAGCSMVELNKSKYYNQLVAQITVTTENGEENLKFTKKDLIQAYNSYGNEYLKDAKTAKDVSEGFKKIIDSMIDRKLLVMAIKSQITLTEQDNFAIEKGVHEYLDNSLAQIEETVLIDWEMDRPITDNKEEVKPLRAPKNVYVPKIERKYDDNNNAYLEMVKPEKEVLTDPGKWTQKITDEKVSKEAYSRFIKGLQDQAKEEGRSTKEEDVFKEETKRVRELLVENKYIEKYQEMVEFGGKNKNDVELGMQLPIEQVLSFYKNQYLKDKELYQNDFAAFNERITGDNKPVYYVPSAEATQYVNINQVLLSFSDEQKEDLKNYKNKICVESGKLEENWDKAEKDLYNNYKDNLVKSIVVKYEDSNKEVKETNVYNVLNEIKHAVNTASTFVAKAKAFDGFIYKYNDDPGIVNSEFMYQVNLDTNVQDKMVKEFADEARRLSKEQQNGGNMSELVVTDYGCHILFNCGIYKSVTDDINGLNWETLYNKTVNPTTDKTWFHFIFDKVYEGYKSEQVNNALQSCINTEKSLVKKGSYKIYPKAYKDLVKVK